MQARRAEREGLSIEFQMVAKGGLTLLAAAVYIQRDRE